MPAARPWLISGTPAEGGGAGPGRNAAGGRKEDFAFLLGAGEGAGGGAGAVADFRRGKGRTSRMAACHIALSCSFALATRLTGWGQPPAVGITPIGSRR